MTREEHISNLESIGCDGWNVTTKTKESLEWAISKLKENKGDLISRQSLKQKLQEHHDFFVNAYGGFSNLPQNDKSRVDEITNCIAMVVNEPSVTIPPVENKGEWIPIVTRPMTDEEKEYYTEHEYPVDFMMMYDCPMPDDGQEVLITTSTGDVTTDTYYIDEGGYFENYCDEGDVKAWMPKPEPYKAESEGSNDNT